MESFRVQGARVHTFHSLTQEISNPHELRVRCDNFAKLICQNLGYSVTHIMLWNSNEEMLVMAGAHGKPAQISNTICVAAGDGLVGRCFASRSYTVCNDVLGPEGQERGLVRAWQTHFAEKAEHDRTLRGENLRADDFIGREKIKAVVFLPLGAADYKLGVLFINYRAGREFSPSVQAQLRAFGSAFTLAIRILHERARAEYVTRTGVHRSLTRYLYRVHVHLNQVRGAASAYDYLHLEKHLQELEHSIQHLRGRVSRDADGIFSEPAVGLRDALYNVVSDRFGQDTVRHQGLESVGAM